MKWLRKLDYFGVNAELRVDSNKNYKTQFGGGVFIFWIIGIFSFILYSFILWIKKENCLSYFSNKIILPSPQINLSALNFMAGMAIMYENLTIANSDFSDYLEYSFIFETTIDRNNANKYYEKIDLRNCNTSDFKNIKSEVFNKLNISEYLCPVNINKTIEGLFTDNIYSLVKFVVSIKKSIYSDPEKYNILNDFFLNNTLRMNIYFIDTAVDITNIDNPITLYVNSFFTFLDLFTYKRIHLEFMRSEFYDDYSIWFNFADVKYNIKYDHGREYFFSVLDRLHSTHEDCNKLVTIYLRSYQNIRTIKREYQKLSIFLASVSSMLSSSLFLLIIFMRFINDYFLNQFLIFKTIFFKEDIMNNSQLEKNFKIITEEVKKSLIDNRFLVNNIFENIKNKDKKIFIREGSSNSKVFADLSNNNLHKERIYPEINKNKNTNLDLFSNDKFQTRIRYNGKQDDSDLILLNNSYGKNRYYNSLEDKEYNNKKNIININIVKNKSNMNNYKNKFSRKSKIKNKKSNSGNNRIGNKNVVDEENLTNYEKNFIIKSNKLKNSKNSNLNEVKINKNNILLNESVKDSQIISDSETNQIKFLKKQKKETLSNNDLININFDKTIKIKNTNDLNIAEKDENMNLNNQTIVFNKNYLQKTQTEIFKNKEKTEMIFYTNSNYEKNSNNNIIGDIKSNKGTKDVFKNSNLKSIFGSSNKISQKSSLDIKNFKDEYISKFKIRRSKTLKLSTWDVLMKYLLCKLYKKKKFENHVYNEGQKKLNYYLDVLTLIKKSQELELIKRIIFSKDQQNLINFLSKPLISVFDLNFQNFGSNKNDFFSYEKMAILDKNITSEDLENILSSYKKLLNDLDKNETNKYIIKIFETKIKYLF